MFIEALSDLRKETLIHDGERRSFLVDIPSGFDPGRTNTAVVAYHGGGGDAERMMKITEFGTYRGNDDFLAVYPESLNGNWNDARPDGSSGSQDDIGFTKALIQKLGQDYGVDRSRVFGAGVSNGGTFLMRVALEVQGMFGGYAIACADLFPGPEVKIPGQNPLPMAFFHYTRDPLMPFEPSSQFIGAEATVDFFAAAVNGSAMRGYEAVPDTADDGMTVKLRRSEDRRIASYVVNGESHDWPGMDFAGASQDIKASEIALELFRRAGL